MNDLRVSIGSGNGDGKRSITYRHGQSEYPDTIDVNSGWQREQSMRRALEALGLPADNLPALAAEVVRLAKEKDQQTAGATKDRFPLVSSKSLDSENYTVRPIIDEMLFAGSPAVDGGLFKTGKTLVAIDGAISIASGRPFLGRFAVPEPLSVVYFSGEGGPAIAQEYGRRIAASKGLALSDVANLRWCFNVPRLEKLEDLDAIQRIHDETAAEVVVLDNLMLCLSGDEAGNLYKMGMILGNVIRVCGERGITPLFVHHFKRTRATAGQFDPGELADLTQAGAAEIAGQWWLLTRRQAYDPDQAGEHRLWLSVGGRVGHSSLHALDVYEGRRSDPGGRRWEVEVLAPDEVRQDALGRAQAARDEQRKLKAAADLDADRSEIVGLVTRQSTPETKNGLRDRASCGHTRFARAFASLITDGTLEVADVQKANGQNYQGWRVKNGPE
jgi:hypothetical protein